MCTRSKLFVLVALILAAVLIGCGEPETPDWKKVQDAIENNDFPALKRALESGISPEVSGPNSPGPLMLATSLNLTNHARLLVEHGANVRRVTTDGMTPIHAAALRGNLELVKLFLEHGADPAARMSGGMTPLGFAKSSGSPAIEEILRQALAARGLTPDGGPLDRGMILQAVRVGDLKRIHELLPVWPGLNEEAQGTTLLGAAVAVNRLEVVKDLLDLGADPSVPSGGNPPLCTAVRGGFFDVAQVLMSRGADVNARSSEGYSPLALAWLNRREEILPVLEKGGAKCMWPDEGAGLLWEAAARGDVQAIEKALSAGVAVNPGAGGGHSALHLAVLWGRKDAVAFLLGHGASPSLLSHRNTTPLHLAARAGRLDLVELLVTHGAGLNIADLDGRTPLALAEEAGHDEVAAYLEEHGGRSYASPDSMGMEDYELDFAPAD